MTNLSRQPTGNWGTGYDTLSLGKPYVLLPRDEYYRLTALANSAELPSLPEPDDNVRGAVDLPDDINAVCLGAVPLLLARQRIIERIGYAATNRPEAHARPVSV